MEKDIRNWWKQAIRDFKTAENCYKSKDYYASAFFAQQAVEKGLKARCIQIQKRLLKIHDLVQLAREIRAPDYILVKCAQINPVYTEVRYPEAGELPADKVNEQEAKAILSLAQEVLQWIEKVLSSRN